MKITVSNLIEEYPKLNIQLPKELNKDEFEFVKDNIDLYSEDDTIKKYIDTFVLKLNEFAVRKQVKITKSKPEHTASKPEKKKVVLQKSKGQQAEPKKSTKRKKSTPKKEKTDIETKIVPVEHFTLEERFIKRYLLLDGKVKTKSQILNFIKSLQKAITDRQIRKSSKYADVIEKMQNNLVKLYNTTSESIEGIRISLESKAINELQNIVGDKKVRLSVTYIKRFIGLYGKETKEKVTRLQNLIANAIEKGKIKSSDPYFEQLKTVQKALKNYLNNDDITISESELRGLSGIAGQASHKQTLGNPFESTDVVSSLELQKAVFRHMGFTGIWKKIIGDPEEPFQVMIYGPGGKGKSTFGIKFATYLSKDLNKHVLYVADEEKISDKLKDKLQRFNAYNKNLSVTGKMLDNLKGFDVVFLDSVTSMGMEPEDFEIIQEQNPGISFIYILQTNKQGSFYGKKKWEHLCDVVLRFEDGTVNVEKNRFGMVGEYSV
jgi:pantothenate kinase-related protein Tda10